MIRLSEIFFKKCQGVDNYVGKIFSLMRAARDSLPPPFLMPKYEYSMWQLLRSWLTRKTGANEDFKLVGGWVAGWDTESPPETRLVKLCIITRLLSPFPSPTPPLSLSLSVLGLSRSCAYMHLPQSFSRTSFPRILSVISISPSHSLTLAKLLSDGRGAMTSANVYSVKSKHFLN